jgi:hypothetical protein
MSAAVAIGDDDGLEHAVSSIDGTTAQSKNGFRGREHARIVGGTSSIRHQTGPVVGLLLAQCG